MPDSGPTVASRTAMVVGGLLIKAARPAARRRSRRPPAGHFADSYRDYAPSTARCASTSSSSPTPTCDVRRRDLHRRRLPGLRLGRRGGPGRRRPGHRRGHRARRASRPTTSGRIIHPVLAEGQVEGGTLQAVGYATIEEIKLVDGRYLNDRLATYLIPTALDAPRIEAILVEKPYSGAPHGAKGVGELPMDVGAPAVVAAIHDATGVWIHDLPATPERILLTADLDRASSRPSRLEACRGGDAIRSAPTTRAGAA